MSQVEAKDSPALQFVISQGWKWRYVSEPKIELEICPSCKKDNYHCMMELHRQDEELKNRDGLYICVKCGEGGNLYSLKQKLGFIVPNLESRKDAGGTKETEPLPDLEACHERLLADESAMDYLINGRGFSMAIIKQQKIGLLDKRFFRECGEVKALVYPYLVNGQQVFAHFRTLPTMPLSENKVVKAFSSPKGWDAPLYNGEILNFPNMTDVTFVEGEPNTIAAMDKGLTGFCGIPGANFKKAEWIDSLDKLERVYICYDKDKTGQKAAQELANRIGIEKCWKITLPDFQVTTEDGQIRPGKDLNEWFTQGGGTAEEFEKLKQEAVLFDVAGVASSKDAVQEFYEELTTNGVEPKYKTRWPTLNTLVGFDEGDVIDILAPEKVGKTTFAMNIMEDIVDAYGEDGVFICLEMTRARMARKWIAYKAQIADNIPRNPVEAEALKHAFLTAVPLVQNASANREGDFYFCYPKYKTVDDIYGLMRDCIRRYGAKWICIDNIQRLCDTTLGDKGRTQHLSEISKVISQIAKDYNVQIIRILQPHRIKAGALATSDNVDGASQIGKDCDCMMVLHRERTGGELTAQDVKDMGYVYEETSFGDEMVVTVGLSRYSGGGRTTLHYNGATSTISENNEGQIAKMKAIAQKNIGYEQQLNKLKAVVKPKTEAAPVEVPATPTAAAVPYTDEEEVVKL